MTALTTTERLRRAVAAATRSARVAHTPAWRARKKMDAVLEAAGAYRHDAPATLAAFVTAETARQREAARVAEDQGWARQHDAISLAELLGADPKRRT